MTFRLKGSLPKNVVFRLRKEYERFLASHPNQSSLHDYQRRHFAKLDRILDGAQHGPRYLQNERIAKLLMDSFVWLHRERHWHSAAVVIMPNHVHALLIAAEQTTATLDDSLRILKGYTSREANRILDRTDTFWSPETFDDWCRTPETFESVAAYIRDNPVKASLVKQWNEWPWLHLDDTLLPRSIFES